MQTQAAVDLLSAVPTSVPSGAFGGSDDWAVIHIHDQLKTPQIHTRTRLRTLHSQRRTHARECIHSLIRTHAQVSPDGCAFAVSARPPLASDEAWTTNRHIYLVLVLLVCSMCAFVCYVCACTCALYVCTRARVCLRVRTCICVRVRAHILYECDIRDNIQSS